MTTSYRVGEGWVKTGARGTRTSPPRSACAHTPGDAGRHRSRVWLEREPTPTDGFLYQRLHRPCAGCRGDLSSIGHFGLRYPAPITSSP